MVRVLELYSGIGGFAAATADLDVRIVGAFDQSPDALKTYRLNFPGHPARQADLERISAWELTSPSADLWWLSPPCQPYCERGARRDLDDPRSKSLIHIMELLARIPDEKLPANLALENVAGFTQSAAREKLLHILAGRGYSVRERTLCPTELGVPSRRPRYYLAASFLPFTPENPSSPRQLRPLSGYLDEVDPLNLRPELQLPVEIVSRFGKGLPILDPNDKSACTTCFTAGYGRSIVNAGSYLVCDDRIRYFSPEEIARLLQFPNSFRFPEGMTLRKRWHLTGNSLSVVAVREVLRSFPDITGTQP
jgi:DNA (cytosine-5)-methyltransferase 1/tRNA (cytosine38-C5)-methyltransferase